MQEPRDISIERLELAEPKSREVVVDLHASGVCHTDYHFYTGDYDIPFPVVLGHEGAGVVETVGEHVSSVSPGDHVVLSLLPSCQQCEYCHSGRPYLCQSALDIRFEGTLLDGTRRLRRNGEEVNHFYAQSSFATKAVVPAESIIQISKKMPLEYAASLGCAGMTGFGAILNTANVRPGDSIAIFGCGGTGANAVAAASAVSASKIVAIDVVPHKLERATELGATETINAEQADPVKTVNEITNDGVDYAFDFVGFTPEVREQAISLTRPGGTIILSGGMDQDASVNVFDAVADGKTITSNVAGSSRPHLDIPTYVNMHLNDDVDLTRIVTDRYSLDSIEEALESIAQGDTIKCVVELHQT